MEWLRKLILPPQGSAFAGELDTFYMFLVWLTVFFFVLIAGIVVYSVVKFRHKAGDVTPHWTHNNMLEFVWTAIPTVIVMVIFFWGVKGYLEAEVAPGDAEEIANFCKLTYDVDFPLYAKIGNMLKSGPSGKGSHLKLRSGRQPCGGNVVVHSPDFMQNVVLPIYYAGEFCGEFAANRGIRLLGHESIVLELSLWIYFGVGQLIGNGTTGRSSRANWGWLALGSMLVTLLGGIANGSADNCISTFLFAAVDREGSWLPKRS